MIILLTRFGFAPNVEGPIHDIALLLLALDRIKVEKACWERTEQDHNQCD